MLLDFEPFSLGKAPNLISSRFDFANGFENSVSVIGDQLLLLCLGQLQLTLPTATAENRYNSDAPRAYTSHAPPEPVSGSWARTNRAR